MGEAIEKILQEIEDWSPEEKEQLTRRLREKYSRHQLEKDFGVDAEVILEAIHRGSDLTRRMLKGVIADAAFHIYVVPELKQRGWENPDLDGNYSYDHKLQDANGPVTVQVKLQRSEGEKTSPKAVETDGKRYGKLPANQYLVEVQRTRGGKKKTRGTEKDPDSGKVVVEEVETRPYRYDSFEVLAVSMWPSTKDPKQFRYTLSRFLKPHPAYADKSRIATFQPVEKIPKAAWTDDFNEVVGWLRSGKEGSVVPPPTPTPESKSKLKK